MTGRNQLFLLFVAAMVGVLLLFGAATALAVFTGNGLATKMLNSFAAMFSGLLGLGSGYLLGRNGNGAK